MSSYLSSANRGRVLETIDDIRKEKVVLWVSIMGLNMTDSSAKLAFPKIVYFMENLSPGQLNVQVPRQYFNKKLFSLNNSYGYLINDLIWPYISLSQSLLTKKVFSLSNMCLDQGFINPIFFMFNFVKMQEIQELFNMRVAEKSFDEKINHFIQVREPVA
uniref:Uncharacterized protein n=1 Tax=Megaselia scalaris TaxID=36166 RepID=T1GEB6_MEGSC